MSLPRVIDIGCGPSKRAGAYGVDCHPFAGVDQVFEFEGADWPLPSDHFEHPTHVLYLSSRWYQPLLGTGYLSRVVGEFELLRHELEFRDKFRERLGKAVIALLGLAAYERYYCSLFPAQNVKTWLRVKK